MEQYIGDGIFLLVGLIITIVCAKKGLVVTLLNVFRLILSVALAYLFGLRVGTMLTDRFFSTRIHDWVFTKVNGFYNDAAFEFNIEDLIEKFPKFFKLDDAALNSVEGTGEAYVNGITDSITSSLSVVISRIIGSIVVFLAAMLVISLVCKILQSIKKKSRFVGFVDGFCGMVFGLVLAWIVLLISGSVIGRFFPDKAFFTQSLIIKYFANSSILDLVKILNVGEWIGKLSAS